MIVLSFSDERTIILVVISYYLLFLFKKNFVLYKMACYLCVFFAIKLR